MTRRPNTAQRRAEIEDAMIRLLAREGVPGATMRALARESGLTQGLLHYHHADREDLLVSVVARLEAGIQARLGVVKTLSANSGTCPGVVETLSANSGGGLGAILAALLSPEPVDDVALRAWLALGDAAGAEEGLRRAWAGALARLRDAVLAALPPEPAVTARPQEPLITAPEPMSAGAEPPRAVVEPGAVDRPALGPPNPEAIAGLVVAAVEGAWRVGARAPGVLPAATAAPGLARWLGVDLPAPRPVPPRTPGPARPAALDLGFRLAPGDRRWLDRVVARSPLALPVEVWRAVAAAWTSPGRHYHTLEHLAELADRYAEVARGPGWRDPSAAWLAVLFHDAVYVVGAPHGENERRSAALLASALADPRTGAPADTAAAEEMIRATADHARPPSPAHADLADLLHFLDADLAILGASPARYARYERQVAAEYEPVVGPELYAAGRAAFLAGLRSTPSLFHTPWFGERLERPARRNLG